MADKSTPPALRKPKLSLKRETLRTLSSSLLDAVVGGRVDTNDGCETGPVSSGTIDSRGDG